MARKFLRTGARRYKRLGKGRRKLQRWRKPRGRHNKVREGKKGRPARVTIGFRGKKMERGKIKGKSFILVNNIKELEKAKKEELIIIGKVGKKKRLEIEKRAGEREIKILNQKKKENEPEK